MWEVDGRFLINRQTQASSRTGTVHGSFDVRVQNTPQCTNKASARAQYTLLLPQCPRRVELQ